MSDPISPEAEAGQPLKSLEDLLAEAETKLQEQKDAWLRALADAENARKRAQADISAAHKYGVERIAESQAAFEKAGLAEIDPAPKEKFDPHFHQAMSAVEADADPNTVVQVMQKGYRLHDRLVRPALVTVAKARSN